MDSDNNVSDSDPNSNPASPSSTGGTSSPVATRSNRTADNTSDNDSVKSQSRDSSPERAGPRSPMPEEDVEDGPQSPTQSARSSRSNSASRSPQGPESPPGEPADDDQEQPPPPPPPPANNASTNGGANAESDGEDGSVSSSSSSDGRKPGSSLNRSRSSSRGSRQARRQANLDDGITTSEDDSDSGEESSRSSAASATSCKDDKGDHNRRLRSPPPPQQRSSIDVQPEAISDGDMESDSSDEDKPPSPKPIATTTQAHPNRSPSPQPQSSTAKDPNTKPVEATIPATSHHPPAKELNLTHDDLSDVSDLDDDDSLGGGESDKKADSDDEEGKCSDGEIVGKDKDDNDDDEDGILSPVNEVDKGDKSHENALKQLRKNVIDKQQTESNSTTMNRTNPQILSTASKPLHPRITHENNNADDNDEEQLDFEAEEGEQQDQEESSEANKDNSANTNSSVDTINSHLKEHSIDRDKREKQDRDKSPKSQKAPLLPTPTSSDSTKDLVDGKEDGNNGGATSNGKIVVAKEPIELEEGEVSDEDEARPEETEPRPVCRFFSRGQCTWGASCRFLHPGVTDKGHYTMFELVRPTLLSEYGTVPPSARVPSLLDDPRIQPPHGNPQQPPIESAWERGLRTAKEMLRKSIKRKEQDMDFEEKKMNMTLAQQQDEEDEGLREAENGAGYYVSGSGRTPSTVNLPTHERDPPPTSSRHRLTPTDLRDREIDAIYGRETALRMEQQQRHMEQRMDHRHLDRLERMAAAEAAHPQGHRAGGMMVVEREHRRSRVEESGISEDYYQHQVGRSSGGRYQVAGGQVVPAHHLIYQEEYSSSSQRPSLHPSSARSYSRHPSEIPASHQHHPASHLAPTSYREHRPDYYHDQRAPSQSSKYMHAAASPLEGSEAAMTADPHREGREGRSRGATGRREVIVQRAEVIEQQQQQLQRERGGMDGYRMTAGGRHGAGMMQMVGARPDEWADPWMRSKSPGGGKTSGRAKTGKKRSYSSASSYSSSSNSSSRSRSSSRSSTRSSLRSRSRSPRGHHVVGNLMPPRHGGERGGRGGRGGRQAVSPSVIVSERKAANERAAAMNPPAPRRSNKAPSPGMMRAGAQNPPAPHQPHPPQHHSQPPPSQSSSNRNKLVLAAAALAARKQHQRVAAVAAVVAATGARRRSSSGSSSGSSSDSDSSSGSSSGSEDGSSGSAGSIGGRRPHNRRNAISSAKPNPTGVASSSTPNQREIALGLALKQAKAIDALKSGGGAQEKRTQIKLNLKAPLTSGNSKKRPAPSSPPGSGSGASGGPDAKKKGSSSRREELLKQLKAVEDAIAKKRSKV